MAAPGIGVLTMSEEKKQNKAADKPEEKDCGAYFCCCFSADPSDKDPRTGRQGTWEVREVCAKICVYMYVYIPRAAERKGLPYVCPCGHA